MGAELSRKYNWVLRAEYVRAMSYTEQMRLAAELNDLSKITEENLSAWARGILKEIENDPAKDR